MFIFDGESVPVDLEGGSLNVLVLAGGAPLPSGVRIRLYHPDSTSAGRSDYTNSTGWAEFGNIIGDDYKLRIDWLGSQTFTDVFTHDGSPISVTTPGGALVAKITVGGEILPANTLIYLRNWDNSSTSKSDRTNTTGWVEYGAVLAEVYRFRVDMLGKQFTTINKTFDGSSPITENLNGGTLKIDLMAGGEKLPYNVLTRLYNSANSSASRTDRLNETGWAEYSAIPDGYYIIRVDWLGRSFYSGNFSFTGTAVPVDLSGGNFSIYITMDGTPMPTGARLRLQNNANTSTGVNAYLNGTSHGNYGAIPEGKYSIRLSWMGKNYYSAEFYHDGSANFTIDFTGIVSSAITVEDNGGAMPNNQRIRLYHADGTYTGKSLRTDVTGLVTFEFIPTGQYMLEYNGRFSAVFTPISTDTINILP